MSKSPFIVFGVGLLILATFFGLVIVLQYARDNRLDAAGVVVQGQVVDRREARTRRGHQYYLLVGYATPDGRAQHQKTFSVARAVYESAAGRQTVSVTFLPDDTDYARIGGRRDATIGTALVAGFGLAGAGLLAVGVRKRVRGAAAKCHARRTRPRGGTTRAPVALLVLASFAAPASAEPTAAGRWARLTPLPDKEGFAGTFAGVAGGALVVAGGTNFPDRKPWEGGRKSWYDTVYALDRPDGEWKAAGRLPRPLGYGVSVTHRDAVICVGGGDADRNYPDAFRLEYKSGKIVTPPLPPLPRPLANACGALVDDTLYVAGGQEKPDAAEALNAAYRIDLGAAEPKWHEIDPCPGGGRILAVAASFDGAFWVAGGAALAAGDGGKVERRYLKDVHRYHAGKGWRRAADLPRPVVAAPSPAPADESGFYVLGGDDGSQVGVAPDRHRGFAATALRYDRRTGKWAEAGDLPAPRVTTPCVRWDKLWVVPSGEMRPGVRSPDVWGWTPGKQE